jgi:Domain of unknown function (DUF4440)
MEKTIRAIRSQALLVLGLAVLSPSPVSAQPAPEVAAADAGLAAALQAGDSAALAAYLDAELWWTDALGTTLRHDQVATAMPALLIAKLGDAASDWHSYGLIAVAQSHENRAHVVRVWVEREGGWRLLAYQEVRSREAPPSVTPGTGGDCDNPCRRVGIEPQNAAQAAVIKAYEELEIAAESRNVELWSARIADEFVAASSNSDRLFDKPNRIAGLKQNTMRGLSPTALTSGRIYDFGDAAVMASDHVTDRGAPLHVTRVWVKRAGQWVEALSYQTAKSAAQ